MQKQQTEEYEGLLQKKKRSGNRFLFSCSDYVEIYIILSDNSLITSFGPFFVVVRCILMSSKYFLFHQRIHCIFV